MRGKKRPVLERFNEKYTITESECWEWTAARNSAGYGTFAPRYNHKMYAHRWAYLHFIGPIPSGLQLDHLCRNRACVNPRHLEPVTPRENQARGNTWTRRSIEATTCAKGHPWTEANTYRRPDIGTRMCRACIAIRTRRIKPGSTDLTRGCPGDPTAMTRPDPSLQSLIA